MKSKKDIIAVGVGAFSGMLLATALFLAAFLVMTKNPPYRIQTNGHTYTVQSRFFWSYDNIFTTTNKATAIEVYNQMVPPRFRDFIYIHKHHE